jgi:LPS-assembly protein
MIRSRKTALAELCLAGVLLLDASPLWAQIAPGAPRGEESPVEVTADKLTAVDGGAQIEAAGNVEIKRQQTTLKADEVRVNRVTQDAEARGNISVDDPEWKVKSADFLQMNLQNETGELRNAELFIEQGHVSITGRRFQKFAGQRYHIDEGFFTTCLCESGRSPWRISADSMDMTAGGLGIVRNGYFYVLDVPVLYVPYAFFPVKTERQSGFLFPSIGHSTKEGFRLQQPFFWAISKSTDATATFDIQTQARVGFLGEFRTVIERESDLRLHGSYFNESLRENADQDVVDRTIADQDIPVNRWSIIGSHRYTAGADWLTFSDIAAYSDDLFTRELIERFDLPVARVPDIRRSRYGESRFGAFKAWNDIFLRGEWNFYQDFVQKDETTLHRTPQIAFWGRRFGSGFPLELRWRAEGVNYIRREGGDGIRLDLRPELVLPFRRTSYLFGSLSLAPRETVYHLYTPVKSSDRNVSRELVEIRGNIGTSLSRIFSFGGAQLRQIKHVVEPELSYLFVPSRDQSRIPIMDAVDRINRRNVFTMALKNRIWGKFASPLAETPGDKDVEVLNPAVSGGVRELGSLRFALSYDVDKERKGGDSLSDLDMNLRITPTTFPLAIGVDAGLNPGPWQITQARATFGISDPRPIVRQSLDPDFNRPNAVYLSYSFLRKGPNSLLAENANIDLDAPANCPSDQLDPRCQGFERNIVGQLAGSFFYRVTDHLLFHASASYDIRDSSFPGYRTAIKILSQCECWTFTLSLARTINPAKTSFSFDFNLLGLGSPRNTLR